MQDSRSSILLETGHEIYLLRRAKKTTMAPMAMTVMSVYRRLSKVAREMNKWRRYYVHHLYVTMLLSHYKILFQTILFKSLFYLVLTDDCLTRVLTFIIPTNFQIVKDRKAAIKTQLKCLCPTIILDDSTIGHENG